MVAKWESHAPKNPRNLPLAKPRHEMVHGRGASETQRWKLEHDITTTLFEIMDVHVQPQGRAMVVAKKTSTRLQRLDESASRCSISSEKIPSA